MKIRVWGVYRVFGPASKLLYIGSSGNVGDRLIQHSAHQEWWPRVREVRLEIYPDERSARAAEKVAIAREQPQYNKNCKNVRHLPPGKWLRSTRPRLPSFRYPFLAGSILGMISVLDEATTEAIGSRIAPAYETEQLVKNLLVLAERGWIEQVGDTWRLIIEQTRAG